MSADIGRPDLSVVMVTHNRAELATDTIASARSAMGSLSTEWLVVDSGSSDGAPEAIERSFEDVRVWRCANLGFAGANNQAIAAARGRYVLFLNPDVEVARGSFEQVIRRLDERPDVGVASVIQQAADGGLQYSIRRDPAAWRTLAEALCLPRVPGLGCSGEVDLSPASYTAERDVDWLVGALLVVRGEALAAVGGFDERFFLYSEETDWCYRFRQAGWKVTHLPVMTVIHHTGTAYAPDLLAQLSYAKVLFAAKHHGRGHAVAMRWTLALRHGARLLAFMARRESSPAARRSEAERRALGVLLGWRPPPFVALQRSVTAEVPPLPSRSV